MQQPKPPLVPPRPASRQSKPPIRLASKHSPPPNPFPDPSSGLLALLVTVAGSSSVHGRPLESDIPPDFLCPRLHPRSPSSQSPSPDPSSSSWDLCDPSSSSSYSSSSADVPSNRHPRPRKKRARGANNIADKYEQSPDGRWRKVDSWELYGSSSCAVRFPPLFLSCSSRVTPQIDYTVHGFLSDRFPRPRRPSLDLARYRFHPVYLPSRPFTFPPQRLGEAFRQRCHDGHDSRPFTIASRFPHPLYDGHRPLA